MNSNKVRRLTLAAILAGIIVLMAFTPLGYLRIGATSITFLSVPVVVGAITLGPVYGGVLGGVFGLTSFIQCFGIDPMGTTLFEISPMGTLATCLVPRILIGVIAGVLFPLLRRVDRSGVASLIVTSIAGALTNTIFFLSFLVVFFRNTYFGGSALWPLLVSLVSLNAVVEVVVCGFLAAVLSKVLARTVIKQAVR